MLPQGFRRGFGEEASGGSHGHVHLGHRVDAGRAARSPCSSADASTPGRISKTCWPGVRQTCPRRFRCATPSRGISRRSCRRFLANCLAHGRRQFVDVAERFPEECRHVLESLAVIYHNDALARERNLSPEERLLFHQAESGPTMEELHVWLVRQFDERLVEPNSALGRGDFVPAEALGEADALPARGRRPAGQQHLRAGVEEGDPASAECPVLQDLPRCRMWATCS